MRQPDTLALRSDTQPQLLASQEVFGCPWFQVHEERWDKAPAVQGRPFFRIECSDGVLVLALTRDGNGILVRQFRPATRQSTLEFPAGAIEGHENPEQAAKRELWEETGYQTSRLELLGHGHLMANRSGARGYLFVARDCELNPVNIYHKRDDVVLVSPAEFKEMVLSGEFEQIPALALLSLMEWKRGGGLSVRGRERHCVS